MSDLIYLGSDLPRPRRHVTCQKDSVSLMFLAVSSCRHVCLDINHLISCLNAEAVTEWCVDVPPC